MLSVARRTTEATRAAAAVAGSASGLSLAAEIARPPPLAGLARRVQVRLAASGPLRRHLASGLTVSSFPPDSNPRHCRPKSQLATRRRSSLPCPPAARDRCRSHPRRRARRRWWSLLRSRAAAPTTFPCPRGTRAHHLVDGDVCSLGLLRQSVCSAERAFSRPPSEYAAVPSRSPSPGALGWNQLCRRGGPSCARPGCFHLPGATAGRREACAPSLRTRGHVPTRLALPRAVAWKRIGHCRARRGAYEQSSPAQPRPCGRASMNRARVCRSNVHRRRLPPGLRAVPASRMDDGP